MFGVRFSEHIGMYLKFLAAVLQSLYNLRKEKGIFRGQFLPSKLVN